MSELLKKILLTVLVFFILLSSNLSLLAPAARAQTTWYNQNPIEWYMKVYDTNLSPSSDIFGERYTAAQVQWIFWSIPSFFLNAMLLGHTDVVVCILGDTSTCFAPVVMPAFQAIKDGVHALFGYNSEAGGIASLIGKNQISGISYTKNVLSKLNPVSRVNAQGFGFTVGANSIQQLWKISRNLSYMLLVIAVIVMAFMIMFRTKINPQTVITIQSALPKIIIAVILITFSYAIAGFIIDLMYVVIAILATFIQGQGLTDAASPTVLFNEFTTGISAVGLLLEFWFAFVVTSFSTMFSSGQAMTFVNGILLFIFSIVSVVAIIIWFVKILILLIKTFANIILTIVIGPLQILAGTVMPGAGFGPWLKKLISYLAVYPVMDLLFFLAFFFLAQAFNNGLGATILAGQDFVRAFPFNPAITNTINANSWSPPLTTGSTSDIALLWALVAFTIIGMIPKIADMVKAAIQGREFDAGNSIGVVGGHLKSGAGLGAGYGATYLEEVGEAKLRSDSEAVRRQGRRELKQGSALKSLQQFLK